MCYADSMHLPDFASNYGLRTSKNMVRGPLSHGSDIKTDTKGKATFA
jgi:hypothetical protein